MQQVSAKIDPKKKSLVITKNNASFHKEIIVFVLYTLTIYGLIFLFYFFLREKIATWAFIIFSFVFFSVFFLMNREKLRRRIIGIERCDDKYFLNKIFSHKIEEPKKIVLYEFIGETFINSIGNISLKISNKEYPLYYAATDESASYIKSKLEDFFQEELEIQKRKIF